MFIESYHRRLFYEYEGNQLSYLTERATASMATNDVYVPGPTARMGYSYDWNGNMTNDYRKGLKFQYNFVNLVRRVQDDDGSTLAEYTYSVDGRKRQAVGGDGKGFRYRGDLVYTVEGGSLSLESAAFGDGRIAKTSGSYSPLYFVTDHLGSVRVVEDQSGTVCESNDYYPLGSRWKDPTSKVSTNRYRFSGKEEQTLGDLGYLDFGARMYDPALGRWFTQDPMAEKHFYLSPYNYCAGNPVSLIDPDGKEFVDHNGVKIVITYNRNGTLSFSKNATIDVMRAAKALYGTPTGRTQLRRMDQSDIKVKLSISPESKTGRTAGGKLTQIYGEATQGNFNESDNYARKVNPDGTYGITEASIIIYEGTIKGQLEQGQGKHQGLTLEQAIGAVVAHEGVHATDKSEIHKDIKEEMTKYQFREDREVKPNAVERQIMKEYKILNKSRWWIDF